VVEESALADNVAARAEDFKRKGRPAGAVIGHPSGAVTRYSLFVIEEVFQPPITSNG